jgi:photosystem II stability/assembly factor-like uncharacterized protein
MKKRSAWLLGLSILAITFIVLVFTSSLERSSKDRFENYEEFLANHPYNDDSRKINLEEWKNTPKADRPDLAWQQNFIMTMDPSLGHPSPEKLTLAKNRIENASAQYRMKNAGLDTSNLPDLIWEERGPYDVGGRTRAIMYDPNDNNLEKVWAGGVSGGLWYNSNISNASNPWVPIDDFWKTLSISAIAYDPTNTQVFYVGTGEGFGSGSGGMGDGLFKSSDGGQSWSQLSASSNMKFVRDLVVRNENGQGVLYVAVRNTNYNGFTAQVGDEGLYRSTDGGLSFTQVMPNVPGSTYHYAIGDIEIGADNRIWVGSVNAVSTDGSRGGGDILYSDDGLNFTRVKNTDGERVELAVAPSNAAFIYALIEKNGILDKLLLSTDSGSTWQSLNEPNDDDPGIPASDFTRGQAWYDLIAQVDPNDEATVVIGGINVFRSQDTGNTWQQVSHWYGGFGYPYLHADQHQFIFKPGSSSEVLSGSDGGVTYSSDFNSNTPNFSDRNAAYNVTQYYAGAISSLAGSNNMLAGSQDNGTERFNQSGLGLTDRATGGDGAFCFIDEFSPNFQITSYVYNAYWRSFNSGNSFGGRFIDNSDGRFINPADYDSDLTILYACKDSRYVYRYKNVNTSVLEETLEIRNLGGFASALKVSPYADTASTLFVAGGSGKLFRADHADGSQPEIINEITGSNFPAGYLSCIQVGRSEDELMVTYSNYGIPSVFYTNDGGQNWVIKEGDLPDMPIRWALFNPRDSNNVILATELGVWESHNFMDASPNWHPANNGLANVRVDMLQLRMSDYTIMAATHGRGVYTAQFAGGIGIDEQALSQEEADFEIYPTLTKNKITVKGEEEGVWEVSLYNLQGQTVFRDRWTKETGRIKNFNLPNLQAGTYILNLRRGTATKSEKIQIVN